MTTTPRIRIPPVVLAAIVAATALLFAAPPLPVHAGQTQPDQSGQTKATFNIFGMVESPGVYAWKEGLTVLQAIALAGGYNEHGSSDALQIQREVDGRIVSTVVTEEDHVQQNDVIMVRGADAPSARPGPDRDPSRSRAAEQP